VQSFGIDRIRLDDGPFKQAQDWNTGYLRRLDPDRLLHVFRINAGLPSSARPLGGWEAPQCELRGHFVGHYLSALAIGHAATGDTGLQSRGEAMVKVLAECQAKLNQGGYLSAFPLEYFQRLDATGKVWAPFYTLHKIMAGLLDMHVRAGSQIALQVLTGMAQWVDEWTASRAPGRIHEILKVEFGGMSDVLYELAAVTGDARLAELPVPLDDGAHRPRSLVRYRGRRCRRRAGHDEQRRSGEDPCGPTKCGLSVLPCDFLHVFLCSQLFLLGR
jgi:DUF1680 family protein